MEKHHEQLSLSVDQTASIPRNVMCNDDWKIFAESSFAESKLATKIYENQPHLPMEVVVNSPPPTNVNTKGKNGFKANTIMIEANNALLDFQAADKTPWYDKISNEDFRLPAIEPLIVESNAPGFSPEDQVENNISCVDVSESSP